MKQIQKAKRHRGSADGRPEPRSIELRDPDVVRAHWIARRRGRPRAGRVPAVAAALQRPSAGGNRS
jgi:hypothetical protein